MEILAGLLCGLSVVVIIYRSELKRARELKVLIDILQDMEGKAEDRIWQKLEKMDDEITNIKVVLGQIKVKLAVYASGFSIAGSIIVWAIKTYVIKA